MDINKVAYMYIHVVPYVPRGRKLSPLVSPGGANLHNQTYIRTGLIIKYICICDVNIYVFDGNALITNPISDYKWLMRFLVQVSRRTEPFAGLVKMYGFCLSVMVLYLLPLNVQFTCLEILYVLHNVMKSPLYILMQTSNETNTVYAERCNYLMKPALYILSNANK